MDTQPSTLFPYTQSTHCHQTQTTETPHTPSCLLMLTAKKDIVGVKALLLKKANVNERNDNQWTPLMEAAYRGFSEIAKLLLKYGADGNARCKYGDSPLTLAAQGRRRGHHKCVKLLLKAKADLNASDTLTGDTALLSATEIGNLTAVKLLLKAGDTVNRFNRQTGETPILLTPINSPTYAFLLSRGANLEHSQWVREWTHKHQPLDHNMTFDSIVKLRRTD